MIANSVRMALACVSLLGVCSPSLGETVNLKATLSGKNEVPPNDSKGSGSVSATFDTSSKTLSWKGSYSGASGAVTAAHFHSAEQGKNGSVAAPISPNASPFEGSAKLTDAQAADLMAGKWYVNLHTAAHPAGEMRGQVTK